MKKSDHIERHKVLHSCFDELLGDFISHTSKMPSKTTVMELLKWSYSQSENPTVEKTAIDNIHDK